MKKKMAKKKAPPKAVTKPAVKKIDDKSKKLLAKDKNAKVTPVDEDDEDAEPARPASGAATGAALATASAVGAEFTHSIKNFRHHPEIENFYRFIYDNDLRFEALAILDEVLLHKKQRKKIAAQKSRAH